MHLLALLLPIACQDQGLVPCHDSLEVGITSPPPSVEIPQGLTLEIEAQVQSICGANTLEAATYTVTSDVDGPVEGEGAFAEGTYSFQSEQLMSPGTHTLTLRVVDEQGNDGDDEVAVEIVENLAPGVLLDSPGDAGSTWSETDGASIVAYVIEDQEPLDSLTLTWTLNGEELSEGPAYADSTGMAAWTLSSAGAGCHEIGVTVADVLGQTASASAEFVLWVDESDIDDYRWWTDEDEDGWGVEVSESLACDQPENTVPSSDQEDCDDTDNSIHPGAPDYCNDGIDSDCVPITPTGCYPYGEVSAATSEVAISGGFYDAAMVGDVNDDGADDLVLGSTDGTTHVYAGPLFGDSDPDHVLTSCTGHPDYAGSLGVSLDGGGDINGDGIADLILGNPYTANYPFYTCLQSFGRAYLHFGSSALTSRCFEDSPGYVDGVDASEAAVYSVYGNWTEQCQGDTHVGQTVHLLADADGDGLADFAIATPKEHDDTHGLVYLFLSSDLNSLESGFIEDAGARLRLQGASEGDKLGTAITSSDLDGDGLSDLIISSAPEGTAGTIYVIYARDLPASSASTSITSMASLVFTGSSEDAQAGIRMAGVGDPDGDGDEEFLVAAPGENNGDGVAYLVPGFYEVSGSYGLDEPFSSVTTPNAQGSVAFYGLNGDAISSVALAGDLNNDGAPDLVFGAPGHEGGGGAYVVYGGSNHWGDWWDTSTGEPRDAVSLADNAAVENHVALIYSEQDGEGLGLDVDGASDLSGDGIDDIVIIPSSSSGTARIFLGGGS